MNEAAFLSGRQPPEDALFGRIADAIEARGLVVLPGALPIEIADALSSDVSAIAESDFHRAGIGRGTDLALNRFVRKNRIHWIDPGRPGASSWLDWTERLRVYLNRRLFLGLTSFESHYAIYAPGDFYKRHVDAFRGQENRVLSMVTYLNRMWTPDSGGELVIYAQSGENDEQTIRVSPAYGTLVIFLSETFPHEVLPAIRERCGVAGWYRVRTGDVLEDTTLT
ncbi:MAG: 2OG-Fe(II) oxygenase [Pseudomonadales bacterium]|nr:2OG-Fe(II) oxygenase [Pseudomonadales bacterium]